MARKPTLADTLRRAVEESDMNRRQISLASGVDPGILSRFVHGETMLSLVNAGKVADVLGIELVRTRKSKRRQRKGAN